MGGVVLGILVWQEGGENVVLLIAFGAVALVLLAWWLVRRKQQGKLTLIDPDLFRFPHFRIGITEQMMQQITLGGAMIALPLFLQMTLEYDAMQAGLSLAPLSLSMFARRVARREAVGTATPGEHRARRIRAQRGRDGIDHSGHAPSRHRLGALVPLLITGSGLGLLVSQLNNYTLSPIEEERVSEAAGVNSAAGSFGLSFGLAMAGGLMLAILSFSFTQHDRTAATVIPTAQQEQIAKTLEDNAEVMSNTGARDVFSPTNPRTSMTRSFASTRNRATDRCRWRSSCPCSPAWFGLVNGFRMRRLPDIEPVASLEGLDLG